MTLNTALIWKEYRELRGFLFAGLAVFVCVPLVEALIYFALQIQNTLVPDYGIRLVYYLGAPFAVLVAIAASCRDLEDRLREFWQSRPIEQTRWLLIKYGIGLAVIMLACGTPLVIQILFPTTHDPFGLKREAYAALVCHSPTLTLVYSVAFFLGCLIRHGAHAAFLSFAVALLIYFVPIILPPLRWLSMLAAIEEVWNTERLGWAYVSFASGMLIGSVLFVSASWLAIRRDWRLRMDQRLIFWSFGGVALMLFSSFAFRLGTNLECEREIAVVSADSQLVHSVNTIVIDGEQGIIGISRRPRMVLPLQKTALAIRRFDLSSASSPVGNEVQVQSDVLLPPWIMEYGRIAWSPRHSERAYMIIDERVEDAELRFGKRLGLKLCTISLDTAKRNGIIHQLDLVRFFPEMGDRYVPNMCIHEDRIYIPGAGRLLIIGLTDPDAPTVKMVLEGPRNWFELEAQPASGDGRSMFSLAFMPFPELDPNAQLEVFLRLARADRSFAFEDGLLVVVSSKHLTSYRLLDVEEGVATFERLGGLRNSLLAFPIGSVVLRDSFAFVIEVGLGRRLTAYDLRNPRRPVRVGHYGALNDRIQKVAALDDGRVLIAGANLRVIAALRSD